ncbi:Nn.00g026850.m01.CDS01 [Neocucurbitaria sp. VM-36]
MLMLRPFLRTSTQVVFQRQPPNPFLHRFQRAGPVLEGTRSWQTPFARPLSGQSGPPTPGNDAPNPIDDACEHVNGEEEKREAKRAAWRSTGWKMFEAAATTGASIFILACVGIGYTKYYKWNVLEKMENAFREGDPVLELAASGKEIPREPTRTEVTKGPDDDKDYDRWIPRDEQEKIDKIVWGETKGRYHLLLGEKGTGKTSMLIDAMDKINGEGCSMMEAHADLEVFRVRLGRCLDFEYHEDNIGSLFSIRGPRDAGAILDIERAFNKLEKVALRRRATVGKPLILIINSAHLIRDDEDGRDLLELIQQRAEQWAASNLATIIINSDKYWVFERLKQYATRMEVHQIKDLCKDRAMQALRNYRMKYYGEKTADSILEEVYDKIGGRLTFLNRVAKSEDMVTKCDHICDLEKIWFLNNCAILGEEMDDDVMDQQKYASTAMVLANALYKQYKDMDQTYDPQKGHILPMIPLHRARFIMTRSDFIRKHHDLSIFSIDSHAMVRADSVPMQRAFNEICSEPGFEEFLEATLDRISGIESLGRTKELTFKDLWDGGKYKITTRNKKGEVEGAVEMETVGGKKDEDDKDDD